MLYVAAIPTAPMDDAYSPAPLSYSYLQMVQIPKIDGTRTGWAVIPIDYAARGTLSPLLRLPRPSIMPSELYMSISCRNRIIVPYRAYLSISTSISESDLMLTP